MADPATPVGLNHLAFPCFDPAATHRFWSELLGLALVEAVDGTSEEWGGREFLHTGYALPSGQLVTFFVLAGAARPADDGLPRDIRHLALTLPDEAAVAAWPKRLTEAGVEHWTEDHGGQLSVYAVDPNGIIVELTAQAPGPARGESPRAAALVRKWAARGAGRSG